MTDHLEAYRGLRERVTAAMDPLDAGAAEQRAPATPDWRIKDVLAHLVGVNADALAGNLEGAGSDPWTEAQVAPRRDNTVAELLTEWADMASAIDEMIPHIPENIRGQFVFDAVTHEFDIAGTLGQPGGRESEAAAIGFAWAADIVAMMRDGAEAGALCLRTEHGDRIAGSNEVSATVSADRFELLRAMTGRRSTAQVEAYAWDGEVATSHLVFLGGRTDDLIE